MGVLLNRILGDTQINLLIHLRKVISCQLLKITLFYAYECLPSCIRV